MRPIVFMALLAGCVHGAAPNITNQRLVLDMVQNNPGDAVGWEQSKYFNPATLSGLGYTGRATTGEMSGTQGVDFHTLGQDFFPAGSQQRAWLDAYAAGVDRFLLRTKGASLRAYFFVDMIVLPTFVIKAYPNITDSQGNIEWCPTTQMLLGVLIDETFARFPSCDGFIVRTGETYVFDTPYHQGNSPSNGTNARWTEFVTFLRQAVAVRHQKDLIFRSWDNWASLASVYQAITDPIPPHPQLYFSIKHSAADFWRPAQWNPQLGVGQHAQIVEVELQREYEGKGAYPNYVMDGVISGFPEMNPRIGLDSIIGSTQLRGLWTWTRGGGWWGPYIHGQELWIDLHVRVLLAWWQAQGRTSEEDIFASVCVDLVPGCQVDSGCCSALRNISQSAALAVLYGQWGNTLGVWPGDWMRDDRIGGITQTEKHFASLASDTDWTETVALRQQALSLWQSSLEVFLESVAPHIADPLVADFIETSIRYGLLLYQIVEASWRVMAYGYRVQHSLPQSPTDLQKAISDYDVAWNAYRAFGLVEFTAASLYHDYYLCLGDDCNNSFVSDGKNPGIGATVDSFRNTTAYPERQHNIPFM